MGFTVWKKIILTICASAMCAGSWSMGRAAEPERRTIVILGDSIAAGSGVDPSEAFPGLIEKRIREKQLPYDVVNAGLSGDTTAGGARRMP